MLKPAFLTMLVGSSFGILPLCAAEPEEITFGHIGLENGLSQSTVFSINQDRLGNLWFATYDGVNKFNGYDFTVYQHNASDPHSIANDIARVIAVDTQKRVWIGTRDGLSLYDEEKDRFENYSYKAEGKKLLVNGIVELSPERLLISTPVKLLVFDTNKRVFLSHYPDDRMKGLVASAITRQGDDIYIGTADGKLYAYSVSSKQFSQVCQELGGKGVQDVIRQSSSRLWVATEGAGLFLINPHSKEIQNYHHIIGDPNSLSSNYIRSLALDTQNRLWIGTFSDLNIYHEGTDSFVSYTHDPLQGSSLSQNSVRSIFVDSQGGVWLGTFFGSINYYHPLRNRFRHLKHIPYHNSLNDNVMSCIVEDNNKDLWIGTNDGGLNYYNTQTNQFTNYVQHEGNRNSIGSNNIRAIYIDEARDEVYIGTHTGGFSVLNRKSQQIETFNTRNSILNEDNVYSIVPVNDGKLWLTTLTALYKYNPQTKQLQHVDKETNGKPLYNKQTTLLYKDSKNRLWIGGDEGFTVYNQLDDGLTSAPVIADTASVRSAFINCIYEARNRIIWIGTREGVYGYDEEKKVMKHYTTRDYLPNNVVYGILEDNFGRLWMSTNKGITCFDAKTEKFRTFTVADGLQSNQFNTASYCRTTSGQIYFGGINGITAFIPELLIDNPYAPAVVITGLKLFDKAVEPDDDTGILDKNISLTKRITLNADQTTFTIDFVATNYIAGTHNTFAYQMKGYDREWYYSTDQRSVSYSNLPHGTYKFKVRAANNDGKWNENSTDLEIIILPVWYKTWWAILLFITLAVALLIYIFRYGWARESMKATLELERKDNERHEEINQMKMRFFVDISHELRTPLTLILAPLQEIATRVSDHWIRNQLEYVQRNANRLLHLVNQLMDYQRAAVGVLKLKARRGNIHQLIEDNFLFYDKLAKNKGLEYTLIAEINDKEMLYDANYMEMILNNLLSNAFKYTDKGKITVTLKEEDDNLVLTVSDTGAGIANEQLKRVFERFYQASSDHKGSGIGLSLVKRLAELHHGHIKVESIIGEGSTFTVYIPQDESVYKEEELKDEGQSSLESGEHTINTRDISFIESEMVGKDETETEPAEKKQGTLLIVEDNPEILQYLSEQLSPLFETVRAENGEMALNYIKENEVDLIITDVMMPVMDGIKLTKLVKQNIRTCHIPVFILSAKTDVHDQLEGLEVGADDYIPKPFTLSVLTAKIQNMLRTRRRSYEYYSKSLEVDPEKITFNAMDEELLKKAKAVVEKNIDNIEFSTDTFAGEMNMSRSNLHIKLKAITGGSSNDFIRKIRFKEACRLLEDGRFSIAEVSTKVGFNTPSYFATSFKKYFGYLPTEYIKKRRGQQN